MASLLGIKPNKPPAPPYTLCVEPERMWVTPEIAKTFRPSKLIFDPVKSRYLFISPKLEALQAIDLKGTQVTTILMNDLLKYPVDIAIPFFDPKIVLILLESGMLLKFDGAGISVYADGKFNGVSSDSVLVLTSSFGTQINIFDLKEIPRSLATDTSKWIPGRSWLSPGGFCQPKINFSFTSSASWGARGSSFSNDIGSASCIPVTYKVVGTKPDPHKSGALIRVRGSILLLMDSKTTEAKEVFRLRQRYVSFLGVAPALCFTPDGDLLCGSLKIPKLYLHANFSPHHDIHSYYQGPDMFPALLERLCAHSSVSPNPKWPQIPVYEFDARHKDNITKVSIPKSVFGFLFPGVQQSTFKTLSGLQMHPEAWNYYFQLLLGTVSWTVNDITPVIDMVVRTFEAILLLQDSSDRLGQSSNTLFVLIPMCFLLWLLLYMNSQRIASLLKAQAEASEAILKYHLADFSSSSLVDLLAAIQGVERPARDTLSRIITHSLLGSGVQSDDPIWKGMMEIEKVDPEYFFLVLQNCGKFRSQAAQSSVNDSRSKVTPTIPEFKPTLLNRLGLMRNQTLGRTDTAGYPSDFTLICCGEKLQVHSWVLLLSWDYFKTYMASGATEPNQMDLGYHLTPSAMSTLLDYWYSSGTVNLPMYRHASLMLHKAKFFGFTNDEGIVKPGFEKLLCKIWELVRQDDVLATSELFPTLETAVDCEDPYELKTAFDVLRNNLHLATPESSSSLKKHFPDAYKAIMQALISGAGWI